MKIKKHKYLQLKLNDVLPIGKSTVFLKKRKTFLPTANGNIIGSNKLMTKIDLNSSNTMEKLGDNRRSIFPEKEQKSTLSPSCYRLIDGDY